MLSPGVLVNYSLKAEEALEGIKLLVGAVFEVDAASVHHALLVEQF